MQDNQSENYTSGICVQWIFKIDSSKKLKKAQLIIEFES